MSNEPQNESVPVVAQSQRPIVPPSEKSATTPFLAYVGLNEAARLTGVHKTTITRDVKAGRLSYTTDERGNKRYQVADLDRLYRVSANDATTATNSATGNNDRLRPPMATDATASESMELAVLKERLAAREDVIRRLENHVEELRNDKRILQTLIEAKKGTPQSKTGRDSLNDGQGAHKQTSGWWARLWGKG